MDSLLLIGEFIRPLPVPLRNGDEFIIKNEDIMKARRARLVNVYPNPNTGNPTYQFEYSEMYPDPAAKVNPHAWARKIVQGNSNYSIWIEDADE